MKIKTDNHSLLLYGFVATSHIYQKKIYSWYRMLDGLVPQIYQHSIVLIMQVMISKSRVLLCSYTNWGAHEHVLLLKVSLIR